MLGSVRARETERQRGVDTLNRSVINRGLDLVPQYAIF